MAFRGVPWLLLEKLFGHNKWIWTLANLFCTASFLFQLFHLLPSYLAPTMTNTEVTNVQLKNMNFPLDFEICVRPLLNSTALQQLGYEHVSYSGPHSLLVSSQLNELKGFIDLRNCEVLQNGDRKSPLHTWSNLFSFLQHEQSRDSMNRVVSKVQVVVSPGVVEDNGCLHLHPNYLFNCITNLVTFVGNHPWCSW